MYRLVSLTLGYLCRASQQKSSLHSQLACVVCIGRVRLRQEIKGLRANGEAEIGFTQVSEVLPYTGAEVRGEGLPGGLNGYHGASPLRPHHACRAARGLVVRPHRCAAALGKVPPASGKIHIATIMKAAVPSNNGPNSGRTGEPLQ